MSIPLFSKPCLVSGAAGSNTVYLAGISSTHAGVLEAYTIDLSNINAPTATLFASQDNLQTWTTSQPFACYNYPGLTSPTPFLAVQFGAFRTNFVNIKSAGVIDPPTHFPNVAFMSPKNFAINGAAVEGSDWVLAITNTTVDGTNSYWAGIRFNPSIVSSSQFKFITSSNPTSNPLLTIGTYVVDPTRGTGYITIFDYFGGGTMYTTTGSQSNENIVTLTNPTTVDMLGTTLSTKAIPVTMKDTVYILDLGPDGSTVIYFFTPGKSAGIGALPIYGKVPRFNTLLSATALDNQIVIYSSFNNYMPIFNSLDTTTRTWSGPGLVTSSYGGNPPSSSGNGSGGSSSSSGDSANNGSGGNSDSSSSLGVIIGSIVGGLVVIGLVAFLFIRNRRQKNAVPVELKPVDSNTNAYINNYQDPNQIGGSMEMKQNNFQQQQSLYQQQQPQQQQEFYQNPQHQSYSNHSNAVNQQQVYVPIQEQQQQQPQLFTGQQSHVYTPPTLIPQQRQPQDLSTLSQQQPPPVINAQSSPEHSVSSPANSNTLRSVTYTDNAGYPTSPTTATTPITAPSIITAQVLDELQKLYKPPPANPQFNPNTQK